MTGLRFGEVRRDRIGIEAERLQHREFVADQPFLDDAVILHQAVRDVRETKLRPVGGP